MAPVLTSLSGKPLQATMTITPESRPVAIKPAWPALTGASRALQTDWCLHPTSVSAATGGKLLLSWENLLEIRELHRLPGLEHWDQGGKSQATSSLLAEGWFNHAPSEVGNFSLRPTQFFRIPDNQGPPTAISLPRHHLYNTVIFIC